MKPSRSSVAIAIYLAGALLAGESVWARQSPAAVSGEAVYAKYCAGCHDRPDQRVPTHDSLRQMTAKRILRTMDWGLMMAIAYPLRRDEREAVASFLGKPGAEPGPLAGAFCGSRQA